MASQMPAATSSTPSPANRSNPARSSRPPRPRHGSATKISSTTPPAPIRIGPSAGGPPRRHRRSRAAHRFRQPLPLHLHLPAVERRQHRKILPSRRPHQLLRRQ
ncbi:MAG: hypothetical protein ACK5XD_00905, partial [Acidobacteriota bacterium]